MPQTLNPQPTTPNPPPSTLHPPPSTLPVVCSRLSRLCRISAAKPEARCRQPATFACSCVKVLAFKIKGPRAKPDAQKDNRLEKIGLLDVNSHCGFGQAITGLRHHLYGNPRPRSYTKFPSTNQPTQPTQPTNQPTNPTQPTNQPTNQTNQPTEIRCCPNQNRP